MLGGLLWLWYFTTKELQFTILMLHKYSLLAKLVSKTSNIPIPHIGSSLLRASIPTARRSLAYPLNLLAHPGVHPWIPLLCTPTPPGHHPYQGIGTAARSCGNKWTS